jgi:hypothetical protein
MAEMPDPVEVRVIELPMKGGEPAVWLIWGLKSHRCDLLAIATTPEARDRYLAHGAARGYTRTMDELVTLNHLYGAGMLYAWQSLR